MTSKRLRRCPYKKASKTPPKGDVDGRRQGLPTAEAQLRRLETARTAYRDREVDVDAMKRYLADLLEFEVIWMNLDRPVIRYFTATVEARRIEWELWLEGLEKAGTNTWQKAVNVSRITGAAPINGLIRRLQCTDALLNTLFRALKGPGAENRSQFSTEYADTLLLVPTYNARSSTKDGSNMWHVLVTASSGWPGIRYSEDSEHRKKEGLYSQGSLEHYNRDSLVFTYPLDWSEDKSLLFAQELNVFHMKKRSNTRRWMMEHK
ncbi:hypothetical protein MYCTH_96419 [Thermothelomyces thermophilus ATCC 42464]|uniref:Uncharacterized protein n=1 Tax=Thermothelomyces thermophilus (strain ATCC 42464 / BCRC 31852 / DSM 1799) TaxID=573729 RepID=G2QNK2_THET4|nr:uncharacterized protein MYCTH_96419 [Thermothelomyces thermophilus ATCC 42464]AEO62075.1 hypothetical protein MYCTH_96419 [Thermothelomyces thermophilus ATCC 42464]